MSEDGQIVSIAKKVELFYEIEIFHFLKSIQIFDDLDNWNFTVPIVLLSSKLKDKQLLNGVTFYSL